MFTLAFVKSVFLICWKVEEGYLPLRSASLLTREVTVLEMLMVVILKSLCEPKANYHLMCTGDGFELGPQLYTA